MTLHHTSAPAHDAYLPPSHGMPRMSIGEQRKAFGKVLGPAHRTPAWIYVTPFVVIAAFVVGLAVISFGGL